MGMALPNLTSFSTPPTAVAVPAPAASSPNTASFSSAEDHSKKVRKPYTITKSRESWTDPEHDKFLEALHLFDRDWKKIEAFIGSKTVIQIRSHAQKYFLKVQKNGTNEHLPPPRPKRKAAHPYPQKASKSASALPQADASLQDSKLLPELGFPQRTSPSVLKTPVSGAAAPCSNENSVGGTKISTVDLKSGRQPMTSNYCFSNHESTPISKAKPVDEMTHQANHGPQRVLPDFAVVYKFLGSVFDPDGTDHLQNLRRMDPIDVETVLLLMRNLSVNLTSPDFEDHRKLLSSYEIESVKENNDPNSFIIDKCEDTAIETTE